MIRKPMPVFLWQRVTGRELGIALLLCFVPGALLGAPRTWDGGGANALASNRTNWVDDIAPVEGDAIILDGTSSKHTTWNMTNMTVASWTQDGYAGTVTVATVYGPAGFTNLNIAGDCIINSGAWTHNLNSASELYRLRAIIGGNLTIGAGGTINVRGNGYDTRQGPGGMNASGMSGGSHGGRGAGTYGTTPVTKFTYGNVVSPTNLGSGGLSNKGGGAAWLSVAGQARIDGSINADAENRGYDYYAGAGGSIWLIVGTLTGSGAISANGGAGGNGPGGGGRVALAATNAADFLGFTGTASAYGGLGGAAASGAGTVYRETKNDQPGKGELIIDNNDKTPWASTVDNHACLGDLSGDVTCEFSRITLTNNGVLIIPSNATLIVTNTIIQLDPTCVLRGLSIDGNGKLIVPDVFGFTNYFVRIAGSGATFNPSSSLTIGTNAVFYVNAPHGMACDVVIEPGGGMSHTPNRDTEACKLDLTILGNLSVLTGGSVNVTGAGFLPGYGPGTGNCGGYGGRAKIVWNLAQAGWCYGSITAPTNLGSGGGTSGGGAVLLTVSGVISNDGVICANSPDSGSYTGSGGSVYLRAGALVGGGAIQANAGKTGGTDGGGGGRIALVVTNASADFSSHTGPIQAIGGGTGTGAGTIYLRLPGQGQEEGTLIIDNIGRKGKPTEVNSNVTDAVVGNVLLLNGAYFVVETNQTLTLSGMWSNAASFEAKWGSQVIFDGTPGSISRVYGSNTFMELVCTNGLGKTIMFEPGKTNSIAPLGRFIMKGADTVTNLLLRSISDGVAWKLNVDPLAEQNVTRVDVKDSDALPGVGAEVTAVNSRNSGGNSNWRFITIHSGETNTWTGDSNTTWSVRENWSLDRSPAGSDFICIPSGRPQYPVLDADRTVNGIEIQAGATLELAGYNLASTTNAVVAGAIKAIASETMTFQGNASFPGGAITGAFATIIFQGNADFTGGSFTPDNSVILLSGGAAQSINLANLDFFKINVLNSAAPVSFVEGFSAVELRCEAPDGVRNIQFQQGAMFALRDLILLGSTGNTNIFLRSSEPGQTWLLAVSGHESVRGVDVQDSDASRDQLITATASADMGNNLNWEFNYAWSEWLGASGNNFFVPANWSSGVVPGATSRVLVESANPMTITGAVTVLDLTVGGGAGQASVVANAPLTVIEDIVVLANGTLALNRPSVVSNGLYVLEGGLLTHSGNTTSEVNKIELIVYGDFNVDAGGKVYAVGSGYAARSGPGFATGGGAGSHGGRGDYSFSTSMGTCYGSFIAPTNLGSGGNSLSGGGAVLLQVAGRTRIDGLVSVDGTSGGVYCGAGGSIWIRSGALIGVGSIRAKGGSTTGSQGTGAGGRVSLVVTNAGADFSMYTGELQAYAGDFGWHGAGGAGTVYRQTARDKPGRGTVLVNTTNTTHTALRYTDVPPGTNYVTGEVNFAPFHVANVAKLYLTNDFIVGDLYLLTANATLDLNFKTLTIRQRPHLLGPGVVTNYGEIIWWPDIPRGAVLSTW